MRPLAENRFAVMCFFVLNHTAVGFIFGRIRINNAGMPIAGKKLGATPKPYITSGLLPLYPGLI